MVVHHDLGRLVVASTLLSGCAVAGLSGGSGDASADAGGVTLDQDAGSGSGSSTGASGSGASSGASASTAGTTGSSSSDSAASGPALAQPDVSTAGLTATAQVTLSSDVVAGDLLVACIKAGATVQSVSDSSGGTWVQVPGVASASGSTMDIWYAADHPAGSTTVTVTPPSGPGAAFLAVDLSEWKGMPATIAASGGGTTWTQATTAQTGTVSPAATTANPFLLVGCAGIDTVQTPGSLTDYGSGGGSPDSLESSQTSSDTGLTFVSAYQPVDSAGPFGFEWSIASSHEQGGIAAFSALPATGGARSSSGGIGATTGSSGSTTGSSESTSHRQQLGQRR